MLNSKQQQMKKKVIRYTEQDIERLVKKIIKEDEDAENQEEDNPQDVDRFLELADKYLFKRYSKYAEKINTNKEKATLIAALAQKWGIDVGDLARVKTYLEQHNRLDEIGYDSPTVLAQHAGNLMGKIRNMFNNLTAVVEDLEIGLEEESKSEIVELLAELSDGIQMLGVLLNNLLSEIPEKKLEDSTKYFIKALNKFEVRVRTLITSATSYSDNDFKKELENFLTKLTSSMLEYGEVIMSVDKRLYKMIKGKDRGDYGSGYEF